MEIRLPHDIAHRPSLVIVSDGSIYRFILPDVEFGLIAEHRGKRRLRVEVDREDSQTCEREILGEIKRSRGFRRAALKVGHSDYLELLAIATSREEFQRLSRARLGQIRSKLVYLRQRVGPPSAVP